jgi:hypothetical protein
MVEVLLIKPTGRGAFDAAGKTPPLRSGASQPGPKIISIDQHTPVIDDVDHEHRRALRLGEPHKLHLATYTPRKPLTQLSQPAHTRVVQHDQDIDVRALVIAPGRCRAEQHRKPDIGLRTQRCTQRPQQIPMATQIRLLPKRNPKPARANALSMNQTLGRGTTQRTLRDRKFRRSPTQGFHTMNNSTAIWPLVQARMAAKSWLYGRYHSLKPIIIRVSGVRVPPPALRFLALQAHFLPRVTLPLAGSAESITHTRRHLELDRGADLCPRRRGS